MTKTKNTSINYTTKKIGFIDPGNMGIPMAKNSISADYRLQVYNRTISKTRELETASTIACQTSAAAANNVDTIITMLSDDKIVKETILGGEGILKTFPKMACIFP